MGDSNFDRLVDDLLKAMEAKVSASAAAPTGGAGGGDDDLSPDGAALLKVVKRMSETIAAQAATIRDLQARVGVLDGADAA